MVNLKEQFEHIKEHPFDEWSKDHLQTLYEMTKAMNSELVIELGVQTGQSSAAFLAGLEETGGKLWSCDLNPVGRKILKGKVPWEFVRGNDIKLRNVAPKEADIIFIDTSHEYMHTYYEILYYHPHLKENGIFILHDTFNLDCLGVFAAIVRYISQQLGDMHFYNYNYGSGLGIVGYDLSKVEHLFNDRGTTWF